MAAKIKSRKPRPKRWFPRKAPDRLAALRWRMAFAERGMEAREVARRLGVTKGTLSAVISGVDQSEPLLAKLKKLIDEIPPSPS